MAEMRSRGPVAGLIAGAVALAIAELATQTTAKVSVVVAVGDAVIAYAPRPMVEFGKRTFGTNDKVALIIGTLAICVIAAFTLGAAAARLRWIGVVGLIGFGAIGIAAGVREPNASAIAFTVSLVVGVIAGVAALDVLLRAAVEELPAEPGSDATGEREPPLVERREFVRVAGAFTALAVLGAGAARLVANRARAAASRATIFLPTALRPVRRPSAAAVVLDTEGVSPLVTPNADFYVIDTALVAPLVDVDDWELEITGMVDHPYSLRWSDIADMSLVERYVTIACVSNEVGGNLVGNAAWRGVLLKELLERAGVDPSADQLVGRAVDGFTVGFPVEAATDDRGAMVAIGMNGKLLPIEHGFPARLIVPGLYGYVSATKWLTEIELTTFDAFDAYWIPRGWSRLAPIKTQSRIDVPRSGVQLERGDTTIAGVAWAPTRDISKVEIQIDDGPWRRATLAEALSDQTWRQWSYRWESSPGSHDIRVRATDGDGNTQSSAPVPPEPNGAEGHHAITVTVA